MTKKNKLLVEQSELRQRLNELLGKADLTDQEREDLESKNRKGPRA